MSSGVEVSTECLTNNFGFSCRDPCNAQAATTSWWRVVEQQTSWASLTFHSPSGMDFQNTPQSVLGTSFEEHRLVLATSCLASLLLGTPLAIHTLDHLKEGPLNMKYSNISRHSRHSYRMFLVNQNMCVLSQSSATHSTCIFTSMLVALLWSTSHFVTLMKGQV